MGDMWKFNVQIYDTETMTQILSNLLEAYYNFLEI